VAQCKLLIVCLVFLLSTGFNKFPSKTPESPSPSQLRQYYDSGKYNQEIETKLNDAKEYLDRQLQVARPGRLAIVLDIDETCLSNYRDLERMTFSTDPQALTAVYMMGNAEAIAPMLSLYKHAIDHKVAVFFISERPNMPEIVTTTIKNLKQAGFDQWEELLLKPVDKKDLTAADFKTNARKNIASRGFDIVLNIGDQSADLQGGYSEAKVKIPNPFYGA